MPAKWSHGSLTLVPLEERGVGEIEECRPGERLEDDVDEAAENAQREPQAATVGALRRLVWWNWAAGLRHVFPLSSLAASAHPLARRATILACPLPAAQTSASARAAASCILLAAAPLFASA